MKLHGEGVGRARSREARRGSHITLKEGIKGRKRPQRCPLTDPLLRASKAAPVSLLNMALRLPLPQPRAQTTLQRAQTGEEPATRSP